MNGDMAMRKSPEHEYKIGSKRGKVQHKLDGSPIKVSMPHHHNKLCLHVATAACMEKEFGG